jgi:hypothetical protein
MLPEARHHKRAYESPYPAAPEPPLTFDPEPAPREVEQPSIKKEWWAVIAIHRCNDDGFVELYPTEAEADVAAEGMVQNYRDGHSADEWEIMNGGCNFEIVVMPAYPYGVHAFHRVREIERNAPSPGFQFKPVKEV